MDSSSSNKPDSIDSRSANQQLMTSALPYPSNVANVMCYPQPPLSSPLGSGDASQSGSYLVPPSMASPSSCLTTQQMYSNYPSPYYRSMLAGYQQSSYVLPTGHHSSAFYGTFYNPSSPSVYPGSGQPAMNPMNYYSPSLHPYSMQNHETMWSNNNPNPQQSSTPAPTSKNSYSYENSDRTVQQPPSCSKVASIPPAPLPETAIVEISEQQQQQQQQQQVSMVIEPTTECASSTVIEAVANKESNEFLCEAIPSRPLSKAESVESLEGTASKESGDEEGGTEEEEVDQELVEEEESYESSDSSYTESYTSEDLPPIAEDDDLLKNVPENILNDTSFGDFDQAKEDGIVDEDLQCLLCNNFDHLIPRLDIAIKLEPVVGEPIYRASVLLCTQCDLMLERYLSLEKEVQHLQAQIVTMYQNNKQLMQPDCHQEANLCLDGVYTATAVPSAETEEPPQSVTELTQPTTSTTDPESIGSQTNKTSPPEQPTVAPTMEHQLTKAHGCSVCGKHYSDRRSLQRHMKNHSSEERQERCELCQESFSSRMALKAHCRQAHAEKAPIQCHECPRQFERRSQFFYHVKVHHAPRLFKCQICDKSFVTRVALTTHARIHSGEKPYTCETCNRGFNVNSNLLAHIPKCTGQMPFKCDQCGKTFGSRSLYQTHVKTHQGEFAVKCDICGMGFAKKSHLISHQRTHTKEKPYQCPVCGKAFSSVGNCNSHAKTHGDERKFVCEVCGRKFARRQALETHLNRHTGIKPYQCDLCDKSFHDPSNLFNHKKTHRTRGSEAIDKMDSTQSVST